MVVTETVPAAGSVRLTQTGTISPSRMLVRGGGVDMKAVIKIKSCVTSIH